MSQPCRRITFNVSDREIDLSISNTTKDTHGIALRKLIAFAYQLLLANGTLLCEKVGPRHFRDKRFVHLNLHIGIVVATTFMCLSVGMALVLQEKRQHRQQQHQSHSSTIRYSISLFLPVFISPSMFTA